MACVYRLRVFESGQHRQPQPQAGPVLGHHDAVLRIARLVAHCTGKAGTHMRGIDHVGDRRQVLGALVVHTANAVVVDQHAQRAPVFRLNFHHVQGHAVHQASRLHQKKAPLPLDILGGQALVEQQPEGCCPHHGAAGQRRGKLPIT